MYINKLEREAEKERRLQSNNNIFYICLPFLPLMLFFAAFNNSNSSNEAWLNSFRLALSLCGTLIASHTCAVSYIAWRDLTANGKVP